MANQRKFKVGDRVKIKPASEYFVDCDSYNPKNTEGVIEGVVGSLSNIILVQWSNGRQNSYNPGDLELINPVKRKTIKTIYQQLVEQSTLLIGDIVKVTHKVPSYDLGWGNTWVEEMDEYVGGEYRIGRIVDGRVKLGGIIYSFPIHVLQLVRRKKAPVTMKLTKDYDAVISEDDIKVGCQTITFEAFDKLVKAVNKMRSR